MLRHNYQLTRDLVSPAKPADKTFDEIVALVTSITAPSHLLSCNSSSSTPAVRVEGRLATFVAALRQLSEFCEFGETLNKMIRDRIVVGVSSEKIQLRLLAEPDLTYERWHSRWKRLRRTEIS